MNYKLVQSAQAEKFKDACMAATAIAMFAFMAPHHQFEIEVVWDSDRKPVAWIARVMDLDGFGVGYLGQ